MLRVSWLCLDLKLTGCVMQPLSKLPLSITVYAVVQSAQTMACVCMACCSSVHNMGVALMVSSIGASGAASPPSPPPATARAVLHAACS
jgi:hypothetical protein